MTSPDTIKACVAAIEEMYQPIFGHPELSDGALRGCEDRLETILTIYRAVERKLGRAPRVLDFGCAQGFFSLSLAKLGASVTGVDINANNIALCQVLAAQQGDADLTFKTGLNEQIIAEIQPGQFDIILGLSVFHHSVHQTSLDFVQRVLAVLAQKIMIGIFEVALAEEPLHWAAKQAKNPRDLLTGFAFVHELTRMTSHLSPIKRPLFVASNVAWYVDGEIENFTAWKKLSHPHAGNSTQNTRRYYFLQNRIAKLFTWDTAEHEQLNRADYLRETAFLANPPQNFPAPKLIAHGENDYEVWSVRDLMPGELLLDKMLAKLPYDPASVLRDVVRQLSALERAGLYHNDMRPSNILIDDGGHASLIDFGAIGPEAKSGDWPYNPFLCLMIFAYDIVTGEASVANPLRTAAFNPDNFPEPYASVFWRLFEQPPENWSFALIERLLAEPASAPASPNAQSVALLLKIMEEACKIHIGMTVLAKQQLKQARQETA